MASPLTLELPDRRQAPVREVLGGIEDQDLAKIILSSPIYYNAELESQVVQEIVDERFVEASEIAWHMATEAVESRDTISAFYHTLLAEHLVGCEIRVQQESQDSSNSPELLAKRSNLTEAAEHLRRVINSRAEAEDCIDEGKHLIEDGELITIVETLLGKEDPDRVPTKLKRGTEVFVTPWSLSIDQRGEYYLPEVVYYRRQPAGTAQMKVICDKDGTYTAEIPIGWDTERYPLQANRTYVPANARRSKDLKYV